MTEPTIRALLERIRDRHRIPSGNWRVEFCFVCGKQFPCPDHVDAVAALALLDQARRVMVTDFETGEEFPLIYREIADPGSAATHKETT